MTELVKQTEPCDESLIKVTHGVNSGFFRLSGWSVSEIRKRLKGVFNVPQNAVAFINGMRVLESHVVSDKDHYLEFSRLTGQKGGLPQYLTSQEIEHEFGSEAIEELRLNGIHPKGRSVFKTSEVLSHIFKQKQGQRNGKKISVDEARLTIQFGEQIVTGFEDNRVFHLLCRLARSPNKMFEYHELKLDVWGNEDLLDSTVTRAGRELKKLLADKKVSSVTVKYRDHKMRLVFDP